MCFRSNSGVHIARLGDLLGVAMSVSEGRLLQHSTKAVTTGRWIHSPPLFWLIRSPDASQRTSVRMATSRNQSSRSDVGLNGWFGRDTLLLLGAVSGTKVCTYLSRLSTLLFTSARTRGYSETDNLLKEGSLLRLPGLCASLSQFPGTVSF